jgi:lipoprotein-anchoring transpeptidase ErfK/SrfK
LYGKHGQDGNHAMHPVRATHRSTLTKSGVAAAALALLLSACTSGSGSTPSGSPVASSGLPSSAAAPSDSSTPPTSAAPQPLAFAASPTAKAGVNPTTPITLAVTNGTLRDVALVNSEGKHVKGALSADKKSWHATEVLGYSKTYRLTAKATNSTGEATSSYNRSFTTLTPSNMTMPYLDTIYGSYLQNGATYGIGMIPVVNFDETIYRKKAAERALTVTTSPHVDGSWYWTDDHTVHWRPRAFYKPGTKVTVTAKMYGVEVGNGLYGQADRSVTYRIGDKHVAIANAATHRVHVYFNDKLVRNMPTSMGRGGTTPGKNGLTIYLWTMPGTYTVLGHENPATMSSDSFGLPANSPLGYAPEKVPYATKISVDGIYLHELDATVWAQGHENLSHGCLNLNYENAKWYYNTSRVGDIVKVIHSGGPKLQLWEGGDWTLNWAQWQKGSAFYKS